METPLTHAAVLAVLKKIAPDISRKAAGSRYFAGKPGPGALLQAAETEDRKAFATVILSVDLAGGRWPVPLEDVTAYSLFSAVWNLMGSPEDFQAFVEELRGGYPAGRRVQRSIGAASASLWKEGDSCTLRLNLA